MYFFQNHGNFFFLFVLLLAEIVILVGLIVALIIIKIKEAYDNKWQPYYKQTISLILLEALEHVEGTEPLEVSLKPFAENQLLIYQVENFERRFKGGDWDKIKERIAKQFLIPRARRIYDSVSWTNRNYAARAFALYPLREDTHKILHLLEDSVFLVRAIAASAAIALEIPDAVDKIIRRMSTQESYSHFFYRDLVINQGTIKVFEQVQELAQKDKDLGVHLSCLEILAGKSIKITRPFLSKDLHSTDDQIRLAAVRVYAHNLQKESAVVLSLCIEDSYPQIRMEAAMGLRHFLSESTLKQLEKALSDPEWPVRLQAGLSLKNMGKVGEQILNDQSPEKNKTAYDTAEYVKHFDW